MVWFQSDGKRKKSFFFWFLCGNVQFIRKNFGARYLIVKYHWFNVDWYKKWKIKKTFKIQ